MHPGSTASKAKFVTACQQLLALAVVCAALTPAVSVISLDVVSEVPQVAGKAGPALTMTAYGEESLKTSKLPEGPVTAKVREVALTTPTTSRTLGRTNAASATVNARIKAGAAPGTSELTSLPQRIAGYGSVGVTWAHGLDLPSTVLKFQVRTRNDGAWSDWTKLVYDDEHAPDPDSEEGRHARPGTDPLLVGRVNDVQVRAHTTAFLPTDMQLAVISPGQPKRTVEQRAAIDTSVLDGNDGSHSAYDAGALATAEEAAGEGQLGLAAATYTPQPVIYSRAQWGANEAIRDKGSLHYYEVHAGFVHHTVNANTYTPDEVPGILRSIYAYHTQSRGWSDIGYNFLVDRFGRIWEGRYGGVDRPVVGAHTLNYNDYAFAMSAIGNFELVQPTAAMLQAYGVLFAWKLSLHGVEAASPQQWVGSKFFEAINGHQDAAATACPGKYLYAKIPLIREYAAAAQQGWTGRELESSLVGSPYPDLVMRKKSDGQAYIVPTNGMSTFAAPATAGTGWSAFDTVVSSPDLTGDGIADVVARVTADGSAQVRPGTGTGGFGDPVNSFGSLAGHDLVAAVGDLDNDGHNDLVARDPASGRLDAYLGNGAGGFTVKQLGTSWGGYDLILGPGDLTGDGKADVLARGTGGAMFLLPGIAGAGFGEPVRVRGSWAGLEITGHGDFNGDGLPDLLVRKPGASQVSILPGKGNGRFGHALGPIRGFGGVTGLTAGGSVTGGSAPDVVARSGDTLVVFRNPGTYETGKPIPTGVLIPDADVLLGAGDWDRDGAADLIVRNAGEDVLYLFRGNGQGGFAAPTVLASGFKNVKLLAAVGDMTGDGWPDLMGQPKGAPMMLYPGNGTSGLEPSYVASRRIKAGAQVPVGRWDADGSPDSLFRSGKRLTLYPGNGPGGFTGAHQLKVNVKKYDWIVGVGDMGVNGHSGVVVREKKTGFLWLLPATSSGFSTRRFLGQGFKGYDLAG